jgi:hypothetical protein
MKYEYEIWNGKYNELEGYLYYNSETKQFSMRLLEDYTGKTPDCFFDILQEQGVTVPEQHLVDMWVDGRVPPPNRQGIRGMLEGVGMKEYDRFAILTYASGRCQQDSSYIKLVRKE